MAEYATLAALKDRVDLNSSTQHDTVLLSLIVASSEKLDRYCNRPDGFLSVATATAHTYAGNGKAVQWIDECTSITTVAVKASVTDTTYTDWTTSDWQAGRGDPLSPDLNHTPYQFITVTPWGSYGYFTSGRYMGQRGFTPEPGSTGRGVATIQVTAKWGYATTVPTDIREACLMQAVRWWKRYQSGMSDTLASGELGTLLYTTSIDPDVASILKGGRYIRHTVG